MPKKQAEKHVERQTEELTAEPVVEKVQAKQEGKSFEVVPMFKQYNSFLLEGGIVIPVENGKVTVAASEVVAKLREGGFIK